MGIDIRGVIADITDGSKSKEEVLEGVLKHLAGGGFTVEKIESFNNEGKDPCDCPNCAVMAILKDNKHWSPEILKGNPRYKKMEEALSIKLGKKIGPWIKLLAMNTDEISENMETIEKIIREIPATKATELILMENIKRMIKEGAEL